MFENYEKLSCPDVLKNAQTRKKEWSLCSALGVVVEAVHQHSIVPSVRNEPAPLRADAAEPDLVPPKAVAAHGLRTPVNNFE